MSPLPMTILRPERSLVIVEVTERLVLRIAIIGGRCFAGWFVDGKMATEPMFAAEA